MSVKLRKIDTGDAGLLVRWRNRNAEYFPPRLNPLTHEEHMRWFHNVYTYDPYDHMYIVCVGYTPVGTIGINIKDREVQRVMRGEDIAPGAMGEALDQLKEVYKHLQRFELRVLETNPHAIAFYKKHGFFTTKRDGTFVKMEST